MAPIIKICLCSHSIYRHYGLWSYCKKADCDCQRFNPVGIIEGFSAEEWDADIEL